MQLLAYMAAVSKDGDDDPWYGQGHAALAEHALGRRAPITRADIKAVERAIAPLAERGAITTIRRASVRRDGPHTVRYRLNLVTPVIPQKPGDGDIDEPRVDNRVQGQQRPPETVPDVPRNPSPRPPKSVPTSPGNRGTEEKEDHEEREKEEELTVRTNLTVPRARGREPDEISFPLRVVNGNPNPASAALGEPRPLWPAPVAPTEPTPPVGVLRGNGFCLHCYANGQVVVATDPVNGAACALHLREAAV